MLKTANPILNKALKGKRITEKEALELFHSASALDLAYTANEIRRKLHSDTEPTTYVIQRNINYSNVCTASCSFCAFYAPPSSSKEDEGATSPPASVIASEASRSSAVIASDSEAISRPQNKFPPAYVLDYETELKPKIQELVNIKGTEILFQGGHNPSLGLDYYEDVFKKIKQDFPGITLHALSPAEVVHITEKRITPAADYADGTVRSKILKPNMQQVKETLIALQKAGMDSLPGAGAEILTERVRKIIAPLKISTQTWLDVMETAHELGMKSSATMMYGHVETYEDRVEHFKVLRELQDRSQGFTAFVTWNFQKGDTPLSKIMDSLEAKGKLPEYNSNSSGEDYLRTTAIARIYLDNFRNFQSSWVTQGHQLGQVSLSFGCNDLGGNMMEENVVSAAGTTHSAAVNEMEYYIKAAGRNPAQRDTQYNLV